ncbi:MAG: FtsX-like permease family protein [Verrucomicrobia bacterium]|nr:FtsX-like permease family protein [Verrucomicrobiota bacterium]
MLLFALKMLIGDRAKYIGLIIALSFSSFIISQQAAIFLGIMKRTVGFIADTSQPNIWVMDPTVQFVDDVKPLKDTDLYRVRSVSGVDWAVPMYKGLIQARLHNGTFQTCVFIGIDDASLIGGPPRMVEGTITDLRFPDAVFVNKVGAETKLASPQRRDDGQSIPLKVGDVMELNDNRAYVAGICETSRTFQSQPVVYTTYDRATTFVPAQRKLLSFILVKSKPGIDVHELCARIRAETGFAAYTKRGFEWLTIMYYVKNTGIVINFGVAIVLGFIIGVAIAGQTFLNFTMDNLAYFGTFKAMGADKRILIKMILLQALFVSGIGWGIGIGGAAIFGYLFRGTELSFTLPFHLYLASGLSMLIICLIAAVFSLIKVMRVDPAIVFKS